MASARPKRATRKIGSSQAQLWRCPRCGAKLIAKNLSHACGDYSIQKFLEGKGRHGQNLFERFVALIARCGPYDAAPAKTRVAFMAKVRFASVNRVGDDYVDVHFVLPRALESPRFRKVEHLGKVHVHHLRLRESREFDRELAAWLRQSYEEYGQRAWLTKSSVRARKMPRR
jgi:Domain of unknown function (DUF5655)